MAFRIVHCNINVTDLNKSIAFYEQALGLQVARKLEAEDGSFTLCYLQDDTGSFQIELTWLKDHPQPYELGENESHIAFATDDFEAAHRLHEEMGCIALRTKRWEFILFMIRMTTGWRLFRHRNLFGYT